MSDKQKFIATLFFVIALSGFAYLLTKDRDPSGDLSATLPDERVAEIEGMKDKSFYEDPVLDNLGKTTREVIEEHGEPDSVNAHYLGGTEFHYDGLPVSFVLAGEEGVVNNLYLNSGAEILGTEIGMTFSEIEDVLGEPEFVGFDREYGEYVSVYFLGEKGAGIGELELWFSSSSEDDPTNSASVFWKKYWE